MTKILQELFDPCQIQTLSSAQLNQLAAEIREFMIHTVAETGGHLAPSLGTVELTLALYSVFDFSVDKIIWDVGHQSYTHKIITGRRDKFTTLRQKNGITGFPKRSESIYDAFGTGHASTSISAALGMAVARDLSAKKYDIVAVIGDGALTGGESFEALNHAGDLGKKIIVILNDNEMSIDKNVGAMSEYLSRMRIAPKYNKAKRDIEDMLRSIPHIGGTVLKTAGYIKAGVRAVLVPGGIFEELGFNYIGPLDGHNIPLLQEVFRQVREMDGPILVHIRTKKGKGYLPAENNPDVFHGIGKFDAITGKPASDKAQIPTYTDFFSQALLDLAGRDANILAITAAMPSGTGLKAFSQKYPERFFDVGIAEEHALTLAAGMAVAGKHPIVAIYSTFAQRAYDQIVHDICLQNLPVTLCLDRAGLVGPDGPTHHGIFDFSYLRHIPNLVIMAPKDENELRNMLYTAVETTGPTVIRYPRSQGIGVSLAKDFMKLSIGQAEILKQGNEVVLLALGSMVNYAMQTSNILLEAGIKSTVVNMRFLKPLDKALLCKLAKTNKYFITLEENVLSGGFGSAVAEIFCDEAYKLNLLRIGIPDEFIEQGTRDELLQICQMQPVQIAARIKNFLQKESID